MHCFGCISSAYLPLPNQKAYSEPYQASKMERPNDWIQNLLVSQGFENAFIIQHGAKVYLYFIDIAKEFESLFSDK